MMFIMIIIAGFALTNCTTQPKEETALALINDYMFKTLYYYDDYQPIETRIDSAIHTPFNDTTIMRYAARIIELRALADDYQEQFDRANEVFNIFHHAAFAVVLFANATACKKFEYGNENQPALFQDRPNKN